MLSESDRVDIHGQSLSSNEFRHLPQRCSQQTIKISKAEKKTDKKTQLESLGSVVVSGCPPLASRICRRVSLNSRPGTEAATVGGAAGGAEVPAMAAGGGTPSRNAFSCAAFSARSRLSASICALIAARAFFSSSFSVKIIIRIIVSRSDPGRTSALRREILQDLLVFQVLFDLRGFL